MGAAERDGEDSCFNTTSKQQQNAAEGHAALGVPIAGHPAFVLLDGQLFKDVELGPLRQQTSAQFAKGLQRVPFDHPQLTLASKQQRIPFRQPRLDLGQLQCTSSRSPTRRTVCQLLAAAIVVLVLVQALSCGLFFCVSVPSWGGRSAHYVDAREMLAEVSLDGRGAGGTASTAATASATAAAAAVSGASSGTFSRSGQLQQDLSQQRLASPMLIPRIVHQTYRSRAVPDAVRSIMRSWSVHHGDTWQMRFYDDAACLDFVAREFSEYLDAYLRLPKDVERSDFFRYMVVLRMGGVYADIDTECRKPMDSLILPTDTLVVGWEAEVSDDAQAFKRHFVRKRQVLQWVFAAAPGHPVLRSVCNHIASNVGTVFSNNTNRDTLERTGPGAWTDAVLRHAAMHPAAQTNDPWRVRILPRVAFGVHPAGIDGLTVGAPQIVVQHHFLGSWKSKGGWKRRQTISQLIGGAVARLWSSPQATAPEEPIKPSGISHYPVSVSFEPPFVMMTDLIGHGDTQSGGDVSAAITKWGTWQAALSAGRAPSVVDALIGSLGAVTRGKLLVDVGAGQGFFSLAAAARGHSVIAFETSESSLSAFKAGILYNGFSPLVRLYNVSLGAAEGRLCLRRAAAVAADAADVNMRRGYGDVDAHAASGDACAASVPRQTLDHMLDGALAAHAAAAAAKAASAASAAAAAAAADAAADAAEGGGSSSRVRAAADAADLVSGGGGNVSSSGNALGVTPTAVDGTGGSPVGALRISVNGWEGWVMDGAMEFMAAHTPGVVLLELSPTLMRRSGYAQPAALLSRLSSLGYDNIAHAGYVCDERWANVTRALGDGGGGAAVAPGEIRRPTWCRLKPDAFHVIVERAHAEVPENVLFIHRSHYSLRPPRAVEGPVVGLVRSPAVAAADAAASATPIASAAPAAAPNANTALIAKSSSAAADESISASVSDDRSAAASADTSVLPTVSTRTASVAGSDVSQAATASGALLRKQGDLGPIGTNPTNSDLADGGGISKGSGKVVESSAAEAATSHAAKSGSGNTTFSASDAAK